MEVARVERYRGDRPLPDVAGRDMVLDDGLAAVADDVVCVTTPDPFHAVGQSYERFHQVGGDEVLALLRTAHGSGAEFAP